MDKNKIKEMLNNNRQKMRLVRKIPSDTKVEVLVRLQVAKKDSKDFHTHSAIVAEINGKSVKYYFVNYSHKLPINQLHDNFMCDTQPISEYKASIITKVVKNYNKYKDYHLNPYTTLIVGCLYEDLDLIKEGYLKL